MTTAYNLVWLRHDLRCYDNAALHAAVSDAKAWLCGVIALFIATPDSWQLHHMAPIRQDLLRRRVYQLKAELAELNIPLVMVEGSDYQQVSEVFRQLADSGMRHLFAQTEYELRELQRDQAVTALLDAKGIKSSWFDYQCLIPPGQIRNQQGDIYKVFTPFKKRWLQQFAEQGAACLPRLAMPEMPVLTLPVFSRMKPGDGSSADWPVAEQQVLQRLRQFCQQRVADYRALRDLPAIDGTSCLSPYLAIGVLSVRQCISRLQYEMAEQLWLQESGAAVWLSELIWRDFYKHILVAYPQLIKHQPFQPETAAIRWSNNPRLFEAWCEGKTGYPIVDAAMRQLNETGWMHNRLRMITAGFLVKDLHIDWRWGEQYFMSRLIDGDFAANNGGWQWAASTGTDAVPYFRVFNPVTQSQKFDPQGDFIRRFVPELSSLGEDKIHWPHPDAAAIGYPSPVVEHKAARELILQLFKDARLQAEALNRL